MPSSPRTATPTTGRHWKRWGRRPAPGSTPRRSTQPGSGANRTTRRGRHRVSRPGRAGGARAPRSRARPHRTSVSGPAGPPAPLRGRLHLSRRPGPDRLAGELRLADDRARAEGLRAPPRRTWVYTGHGGRPTLGRERPPSGSSGRGAGELADESSDGSKRPSRQASGGANSGAVSAPPANRISGPVIASRPGEPSPSATITPSIRDKGRNAAMASVLDPTFYRSATVAAAAPPETVAYTVGFDRSARRPDALLTLDVDPREPDLRQGDRPARGPKPGRRAPPLRMERLQQLPLPRRRRRPPRRLER